MAERYWISGTQIDIIKSMLSQMVKATKTVKGTTEVYNVLVEIGNEQFIGNYPTDKDKDRFLLQIKALQMEEVEEGRR